MTKTRDECIAQARTFWKEAQEMLQYLAVRWCDEREYEHIDSYMQPLAPIAEKTGVQLAAMSKRPFGVKFRTGDREWSICITASKYELREL